jgi:hypothetical protein
MLLKDGFSVINYNKFLSEFLFWAFLFSFYVFALLIFKESEAVAISLLKTTKSNDLSIWLYLTGLFEILYGDLGFIPASSSLS